LSTTLSQLEASTRKVEQTEARGRVLEEEREAQALKITQAILDAQREAAKAKEDVGVYQLKLAHAEQEMYVPSLLCYLSLSICTVNVLKK
jgi:hypothetical protein